MRAFMVFVWIMLVSVTGYTLFHISFQVSAMEQELSSLNTQIRKEKESVHVLKAEWTYLNRPERIERLSQSLLPDLSVLKPSQLATFDELPVRSGEDEVPLAEGRPAKKGIIPASAKEAQ